MSCFEQIAQLPALRRAWTEVSKGKMSRQSAHRQGSDGHSLFTFQAKLETELVSLSSALRKKTFRFSKLDPYFLVKPNSKLRVICAPLIGDRVVQRAILNEISGRQGWMFNSVSYGFVTERGVALAVKEATRLRRQRPWVFKTDISKFFDCVDRDTLREKVRRHVRQRSLLPLVLSAIDCEIRGGTRTEEAKIRSAGIRVGQGVRQGMPLSPLFANLFLAKFDQTCEQRGMSALRYADDLIFFAASREEAQLLASFCRSELERLNLRIPELASDSKSQIYSPSDSAEFLGVELALNDQGEYDVRLGNRQFDSIKSSIYELGSLDELRRRKLDVARFGNALLAKSAAYLAAYEFCANANHLQAQLADWTAAVRRKIAQKLGIDLHKLSADGKWFLGIS